MVILSPFITNLETELIENTKNLKNHIINMTLMIVKMTKKTWDGIKSINPNSSTAKITQLNINGKIIDNRPCSKIRCTQENGHFQLLWIYFVQYVVESQKFVAKVVWHS